MANKIYAIQMEDEKFTWIYCKGKGSPTFERPEALAEVKKLLESFPGSKFRVLSFVPENK